MLNREKTGLIIVDIQGKLARLVSDSEAFIANCARLIKGAQLLGLPIVWLEQNPDKLGATVEELRSLLSDQQPIVKFTFSGCGAERFNEAIRASGKSSWLICGIEAHICVYQTSAELAKLGYEPHLVVDCISSRNPGNKELAIHKLVDSGVRVTGYEMCLFELLEDCRAPEFKNVLDLIR